MGSLKLIYAKMLERKIIRLPGNKVTGKRFFLFALLLATLFLTGCVTLPDPETSQDYAQAQVAIVSPNQTVGQTFVSRRARLNGIDIWLGEETTNHGMLVELFHEGDLATPVFTTTIGTRSGKNRIEISPQVDPPNQHYYLRLSSAYGDIALLGRNEDNYIKGTAFINDQPIDADLAFRAIYDYDASAAFSDFRGLLAQWYLILPLGIVLFLPGWLLLDFSKLKADLDFGEHVALALGLSLSIVPLLMVWTTLVGLRWGPISVWLVAFILIAIFVWRFFKKSPRPIEQLQFAFGTPRTQFQPQPSSLILLAIFGLTLLTRVAMVRDLAAPPWVDSVHHGMITRLMLESGGIPETYAPFIPVGAEHYHFGFHSSLSAFIWLTGLDIQDGMLIFGQVLNALIVFAMYLLAKTLTQNRPAALTAALIAGVFTLMPAYYVSWGRYTHLTGLLVLPTAFALVVKIIRAPHFSEIPKITWLLSSIACAGIVLIHYRVTAFWGLLIIAYLLLQTNPKGWVSALSRLCLLALLSFVLLLPWLPETFFGLLLPRGMVLSSGTAEFSKIPWNFLKPGLGEVALVLAGVGLVLGIFNRKSFPFTLILWTGLMYFLANLGVFAHIPGAGFVNPVSMEITLFMPIATLGGYAIGGSLDLFDRFLPGRWQIAPRVLFSVLGAGAAILGAQRLLPTLNPTTFLAHEADFPAIHWIDEHIPSGETILINPTAWGYGLYMGNDGGFWISALNDQSTIPPPVLYGMANAEEIDRIHQIIEGVQPIGEDAPALWELLRSENIRFVYAGARGGIISPSTLAESELFNLRYHQNGTWVFETVNP